MGNKRTPGDTCIIEGCNEPRDNRPGQRRRICRHHVNEQARLKAAALRAQRPARQPCISAADAYFYWGKGADVGRVFHEGHRVIGLKLVGTYYIATFENLTSAPLASDALLRIG